MEIERLEKISLSLGKKNKQPQMPMLTKVQLIHLSFLSHIVLVLLFPSKEERSLPKLELSLALLRI